MFFGHLYVLFEEMSISTLCPFFDSFFFFNIELCELFTREINPLSVDPSFANILSHSVGCLFVLLMVSFAMQNLLSLIRYYLFIFVFIFIT